jgi:hypothetical protein
MIYVPIDIRYPLCNLGGISAQFGITNNFPDIVVELHQGRNYFDIGDDYTIGGAVTNTDLETTVFSGDISVMNPHRGQIKISPVANDFTMTGINTLTFKISTGSEIVSFQITIFVQSISSGILDSI